MLKLIICPICQSVREVEIDSEQTDHEKMLLSMKEKCKCRGVK